MPQLDLWGWAKKTGLDIKKGKKRFGVKARNYLFSNQQKLVKIKFSTNYYFTYVYLHKTDESVFMVNVLGPYILETLFAN